MQLANIIIIGILLLSSLAWLVGVGFSQIMETITSGGINDDGYPFIALLVGTIFLLIYLIYAIKFYIRKNESNGFILSSCSINIFMIFIAFSGIISVFIMPSDGFAVFVVGTILSVLVLPSTIISFVLFMLGKKKSSKLINES